MGRNLWIPLLAATSVTTVGYLLWLVHQKRKRANTIPQKWIKVGTVEVILMYPIKSAKANLISEAECTEHGIREIADEKLKYPLRDRNFVVYGENDGSAINVMQHKKGILLSCSSLDSDTVVFRSPDGTDSFALKISSFTGHPREVKVLLFDVITTVTIDCGDEIASWMSRVLLNKSEGFRVGFFMADHTPKLNPVELFSYASPKFPSVYTDMRTKDGGTYTVGTYNLMGSASVDAINDKLPEEDRCSFRNYRPNVLFKTEKPFVEDKWKWIKIGEDVVLKSFKPCTRCTRININSETADLNKNFQPFKILKRCRPVRQWFSIGHDVEGDKPALGIYAGFYRSGRIKVGDPVYANA